MNGLNNIDPRKRPGPGYETKDLNVRLIVIVSAISLVAMIIALFVINELFLISKEKRMNDAVLTPVSVPLRELRIQEDEVLSSYKIIDSQAGIYQIPIERAMEVLANQAYQNRLKSQNNFSKPMGNRKEP